mmetsp:Transcript_12632/g.34818  ORF Transcript_12632/g.34818 Transcript_12632/m.34818 type:complete len:80 (+) Transcript_12632:480-719(+)
MVRHTMSQVDGRFNGDGEQQQQSRQDVNKRRDIEKMKMAKKTTGGCANNTTTFGVERCTLRVGNGEELMKFAHPSMVHP